MKQHVAAGTTVYGLNDLYRLRLQELTFTRHPSGRSPATMNLPGAAEAHKN